ncbi:hypothetical protein ACFJZE_13360 [Enterococcus faecalis]|uniref:hypothetical protein n=1 Tax=Enterococcus TaxID=1350 RepID=UPI00145A3B95|nr:MULTISPECIES: hypothetical protein [Enterococcus]QMX56559.1 hypothetical protein HI838_014785 [Enterococcus faecium]QOJ75715.1 hypothetical protein IG632_14785 [Enterococcus faecium]QTQ92119.1 hypothetical protein J7155_14755 [Enterococcus faecium]HCR2865858.1 hypothetical protein [Enterococcus faecium]
MTNLTNSKLISMVAIVLVMVVVLVTATIFLNQSKTEISKNYCNALSLVDCR